MSTDLIDYLYLEAKEKAFEVEIEARKEFETKRNAIVNARDYGLLLSWQNELVVKKRFNGPASEAIGGPDSEWT